MTELLFKATQAWYENGRICILLSDKKEIRFPVDLNDKLKKASADQLKNIEINCDGTGYIGPTSMKTFLLQE